MLLEVIIEVPVDTGHVEIVGDNWKRGGEDDILVVGDQLAALRGHQVG
jgi:hypothetical protein